MLHISDHARGVGTDEDRRAGHQGIARFCDLPGTWQHFSLPLKELTEDTFKEGLGFVVDPCLQVPAQSLTCDVVDPITGQRYSRDPRGKPSSPFWGPMPLKAV